MLLNDNYDIETPHSLRENKDNILWRCIVQVVHVVVKKKTIKLSSKKERIMKKYTYNPDKLLSENFRLGEFIESETAQRLGIDNTPTVEVVFRLRNLCREVLQPLRDHVGHAIRINSGYRCEALNEAVHGVGNSQHLHGCAADIHVPDIDTARSWYYWIVNHLDFDQCILEHNRRGAFWLHVSCQLDFKDNRHQAWFMRFAK